MRKDREPQEQADEGQKAGESVGTAGQSITGPFCFVRRSIERQHQVAALLRKSAEHFEVTQ